MKVTDAQACFSMFGGATESRAESIATELRTAALLPKGGRGVNAPSANPTEITVFALAVAGADRVKDAAEAAAILVDLVNENGEQLGHVIFRHLTCERDPKSIMHIRVAARIGDAPFGFAEIAHVGGKVDYFLRRDLWGGKTRPEAMLKAYAGRIGHIGGGVIVALAVKVGEDKLAAASTQRVPA